MYRSIFCHVCDLKVTAKLVYGKTIYPHRKDLYTKPIWQCTICKSYVGCHPNTKNPLGSIVGSKVKQMRIQVHDALDPIWKSGTIKRSQLYKELSKELGWTYHTASIRSVKEARQVLRLLAEYKIIMKPIEGDFE